VPTSAVVMRAVPEMRQWHSLRLHHGGASRCGRCTNRSATAHSRSAEQGHTPERQSVERRPRCPGAGKPETHRHPAPRDRVERLAVETGSTCASEECPCIEASATRGTTALTAPSIPRILWCRQTTTMAP